MNPEKLDLHRESPREATLEPPAVESFLNSAHVAKIWPENIATNEIFLEQLKTHKELNECLGDIFDHLLQPDVSLETALNQGYVTEEQAEKLYSSLSNLLTSDQDYKRIILYLPFELLPNKKWHPSGEKLQQASDRFNEAYMHSWKNLLSTYDVRANFVDGDVLEDNYRKGDHPRVVKAAHLIPKLVANGLIKIGDVIELMEKSDDPILKDSIADTLPVLVDLELLTEKEIKLMEKSPDRLVSNMARIIVSYMKTEKRQSESELKELSFSSIQGNLEQEFSAIDAQDYGAMTKKRKLWLIQKKKQEVIGILSKDIGVAIAENKLTDGEMEKFFATGATTVSRQALVEGIQKAVETTAPINIEKAQALYAQYKETLLSLWGKDDFGIRETLSKTFRRFRQLNVIDDKQLATLNISIPKLAGPFSENLKLMDKEIPHIQNMTASIESNPELLKFIYPVILLYGSRLKGYGEQGADIDLGIFVKSETSTADRIKLQKLLKETFKDEVVEFWLEEKEGQLNIHDFPESDASLGESYWTHILFGAAWEGDKKIIRELREKLLVPYLYATQKTIRGRDARSVYLEEMERDTLQYRLMHKGYEKFFPPYGGIHTAHADEIDGESMFWDSGYRQLATKLFVGQVFLPKIPVSQK